MKKRIKRKLKKRFDYKKYSNKKIKYQNFINYIIELNEDVFSEAYIHQLLWGQSYIKITEGNLKAEHIPLYG